ncbi:hypothetical protein EB796_018904 [Bugula neritina]|uniref:Uncharacterized protein n=1 Tax=Bugula neritina TaxID=10212 RepID=A0A7J7J989_BUGNE|nr:hypothetical protein EB796_018904 [Bugula neritina]
MDGKSFRHCWSSTSFCTIKFCLRKNFIPGTSMSVMCRNPDHLKHHLDLACCNSANLCNEELYPELEPFTTTIGLVTVRRSEYICCAPALA